LKAILAVPAIAIAIALPASNAAWGQDYPKATIRILTSPAGGGGDFVARIVAQGITGPLGQPVIVDNRATVLASELAAKAPPDGYTLFAAGGGLLVYPLLNKAPFNVTDFAPVSQLTREVSVLVVHPSVPAKSLKELIALAKSRPGELNYSMVPSGTAVIGGEAQLTMIDPAVANTHVKAGRLRALAVTSAQPSPLAPGLPTMAASGLPGYEMIGQTSVYVPVKTPQPIIARLNREIVRLLSQPDVKERLLASGVEPVGSSPEELATLIKVELAKAAKIIKEAGIKVE
jgi:tripartite-type tricarboxylate transporter receptor subunit TctC